MSCEGVSFFLTCEHPFHDGGDGDVVEMVNANADHSQPGLGSGDDCSNDECEIDGENGDVYETTMTMMTIQMKTLMKTNTNLTSTMTWKTMMRIQMTQMPKMLRMIAKMTILSVRAC